MAKKRRYGRKIIRLFNSSDKPQVCNFSDKVAFSPFEVKTFKIDGKKLVECDMLDEIKNDAWI